MLFNPGILRNYDIRGAYGKDFDDEFAFRLGAALVYYFKANELVVARDMRESSAGLTQAVIRGITSTGCNVVDIWTASSPFFYYAVIHGSGSAGVMITASHMGPEFNGFKICRKDAMTIGKESGLLDIMKIIQAPDAPTPAPKLGIVAVRNLLNEHADFLVLHSQLKPGEVQVKVAIEAEPMIRRELDVIFQKLGIAAVQENYDIKFGFDADGDRLLVYNAHGLQIRGDLVTGVLAADLAQHKHFLLHLGGGPKVVSDLRGSRGTHDYLVAQKIDLLPSRIGHTYIKQVMKEHQADFSGEASGHMMFKVMNFSESTQLALLKLLKIMETEKKTIDELVQPMVTWAYSGEINTPIEGWPDSVPAILLKVKDRYRDAEISELDGLKVDYRDWWFLLRASGTEPLIRLIVEAKTKSLMDEKIKEVQGLLW